MLVFGRDLNLAAQRLNKVLADGKAQAGAIGVHLPFIFKLSVVLEQLLYIFLLYAHTAVLDFEEEEVGADLADAEVDRSALGELERVAY